MDVNAKAMFFCAQQAGRHFIEQGKPGQDSSTCGSTFSVVVEPNWSAYCASKGAALQLTRGSQASGRDIESTSTRLDRRWFARKGLRRRSTTSSTYRPRLERLPARALPQPKDVADAAVFLAGPSSDFIPVTVVGRLRRHDRLTSDRWADP